LRRGKTKIKKAEDHNDELKKKHANVRNSEYFATDGSKMENKPFVGLVSIDINDGITCKFGIGKIAFTVTAESLAISETLELIEEIDSEQNFANFSDSKSVLKGITNTSTMDNVSHITQMLKDQISRLESRGEKVQFYWIPGHDEV
jgi:hypothetical protein